MGHSEESSIFLYIGLLLGMGLLAPYFWIILTADALVMNADVLMRLLLFLSGLLLVVSTLGIATTKTRSSRIGLTMLSGAAGGVHGYLDLALFIDNLIGIIMFAWVALALLLTFATFSWLLE